MGFWDMLGTIAGDVGGSFIGDPLLGNQVMGVIGGLTGGGQDITGAANVGPKSPTFQRMQQLGDLSKGQAFDTLLPEAQKAYGQVLPFYSGILGGNRADISSILSPEISNIQSGYRNAAKNIGTFAPQGGGMTSLLSELPFHETGDITNLISGARTNAANALSSLAGQLTGEAQGFANTAEGAFGADINALLGRANQAIPLQQQLGQGMANMFGPGGILQQRQTQAGNYDIGSPYNPDVGGVVSGALQPLPGQVMPGFPAPPPLPGDGGGGGVDYIPYGGL
jgi:hypothetical protein